MKFANAALAGFVYRNVDAEYDRVISKGAPWDVVVLDDISNDFPPNSTQHARLKRLFSQWYETRCKLIITSNVDVEELGNSIGKMVFSRLMEMVHFVPLPKVDFRAEP